MKAKITISFDSADFTDPRAEVAKALQQAALNLMIKRDYEEDVLIATDGSFIGNIRLMEQSS